MNHNVTIKGFGPFSGEEYKRTYTPRASNSMNAVFMAGILFAQDDSVPDYLTDLVVEVVSEQWDIF